MKRNILVLLILVALQLGSQAQIIRVPSDYPSIQQAIDTASNGDTILIANGTYLENIDFLGKAITLGSEFIMDGDTSHISATIIDGSDYEDYDIASTVTMQSGEDTTSILTGLTITGGGGTRYKQVFSYRGGGGVTIMSSGGKVCNNIIEGNRLLGGLGDKIGAGIIANVSNMHTAIIRNNIIRNNSAETGAISMLGGGIAGIGGRIIIEGNTISGNILDSEVRNTGGGGIFWEKGYAELEGVIQEVIIRNNLIAENQCYGPDSFNTTGAVFPWEGFINGGGILLGPGFNSKWVNIYNNIIRDNYAQGEGGAISNLGRAQIWNNTIYNNAADSMGNSIRLLGPSSTILFNNIIWSEVENGNFEVSIMDNGESVLSAASNLIKADSVSVDLDQFKMTTYLKPIFLNDSTLEPDPSSPAIGRGADSVQFGLNWYYAPRLDFKGMLRPDPSDMYGDLGAIESGFPRSPQSSADLLFIGFSKRELTPSFHRDTLHYSMGIADAFISSPELDLILEDPVAMVDYRPAADLKNPESKEDSTATLTVTSSDGTMSKIYEIAFFTIPADATLKELSVSQGQLEPGFHPDSAQYMVILPCGSSSVPDVYPVLNVPEGSFMEIDSATNIKSDKKEDKTSYIRIIPKAGPAFGKTYSVEFYVDETTPPTLTLLNHQVGINEEIGAISSQSGKIYLVPVDTKANLLYLGPAKLDVGNVMAGDTLYFSSMDLDTTAYWLYAVNECNIISESTEISIETSSVSGRGIKISEPILYPTPVADRLFIRTDQAIKKVEIFNLNGNLESSSQYREEGVYTGNLERGFYLLRIYTSDGEFFTGKFLKVQNP